MRVMHTTNKNRLRCTYLSSCMIERTTKKQY